MQYFIFGKQRAWYRDCALCFFCLPLYFLFLSSCTEHSASGNKNDKQFFDLKSFFEHEAERLKGTRIKKIATVDNRQEVEIRDSTDFSRELKPFAENDINRPAWSDKFQADSIYYEQNVLSQLRYKAIDDKMKTQQIVIDFDSSQAVSKIFIESGSFSAVADTRQVLNYEPKKGYTIESSQKIVLTDKSVFQIQVLFVEN